MTITVKVIGIMNLGYIVDQGNEKKLDWHKIKSLGAGAGESSLREWT